MKSSTTFGKSRPWILGLIVFVLAFDLAFFWQRFGGTYESEFGGHPDEAAHVVTGLFVRDAFVEGGRYAADGFRGSPVSRGKEFAADYYTHYPKIGLGVWPPFFYLVQTAWTLPFGASRTSLLLLMCALAGALGLLLYRALHEEYGVSVALAGAAVLLSLPLVRDQYGMVMAETLSALLIFGAMLAFGNFLDHERPSDAWWFGGLAALAILTKGTGLALVLAAPFALLLTRKFHLLKRLVLWASVSMVLLVAGPWTWATRHLGKGGWLQPEPSWSFTREALPYYAGKFGTALGVLFLCLFAVGVVLKVRARNHHSGRWSAVGALIIAAWIFQSIAPVGLEARHLIPVLPPAIMFSVAGLAGLVRRFSRAEFVSPIAAASLWLLACGVFALPPITSSRKGKDCSGFAPLAEAMLAHAAPVDVTLVSSDATGEGMFIAEVALRERRPGHVIQRASKSLATSTWSGSGYTPAFDNDPDLLAFLTSGKIQYLVLDDAGLGNKRRRHHDDLKRVVEAHPERFEFMAEAELRRNGTVLEPSLKLYQILRKK